MVWEESFGTFYDSAGNVHARYTTSFGTDLSTDNNGRVSIVSSALQRDQPYAAAINQDVNIALGPSGGGGNAKGGPLPLAHSRSTQSTGGWISFVITLVGVGVGIAGAIVASPAIVAAGVTVAIVGAVVSLVRDGALNEQQVINFQTLTGTNTNQFGGVVFNPVPGQVYAPGTVTEVCTREQNSYTWDCQWTFYPLG
jgi:hypothetical protein